MVLQYTEDSLLPGLEMMELSQTKRKFEVQYVKDTKNTAKWMKQAKVQK